jgi:hypothetical protein
VERADYGPRAEPAPHGAQRELVLHVDLDGRVLAALGREQRQLEADYVLQLQRAGAARRRPGEPRVVVVRDSAVAVGNPADSEL